MILAHIVRGEQSAVFFATLSKTFMITRTIKKKESQSFFNLSFDPKMQHYVCQTPILGRRGQSLSTRVSSGGCARLAPGFGTYPPRPSVETKGLRAEDHRLWITRRTGPAHEFAHFHSHCATPVRVLSVAGCRRSQCQESSSDGLTMDSIGSSRCKIVVVGDTQCGKTALLHVFAKDCYPEVGLEKTLNFDFRNFFCTNWHGDVEKAERNIRSGSAGYIHLPNRKRQRSADTYTGVEEGGC